MIGGFYTWLVLIKEKATWLPVSQLPLLAMSAINLGVGGSGHFRPFPMESHPSPG